MPTEINYLALLLPSLGAVLAAIITGFAASWVQHRRNVASDKRTWQRERAKRQRDEVRTCLGDYLQARAAMVALVTGWIAQLS